MMSDVLNRFSLELYTRKGPDNVSCWISLLLTGPDTENRSLWCLRSGAFVFLQKSPMIPNSHNAILEIGENAVSWMDPNIPDLYDILL